jgi:rhamnosyltransferase
MPKVSILLRTRDAGQRFSEVLAAIHSQTFTDREIVVVDSGSRDGTLGLAESAGARIVHLPPERFTHAVSTNLGFEASLGEYVVNLSQDATPVDQTWLSRLVDAADGLDTAAAFGRQRPRSGCFAVERMELSRAYPDTSDDPRRVIFSNVNSIVKKDLWRRHRFDESLPLAEDQEWARWAIGQGYVIGYLPFAAVWHSHDYTLGDIYRRCLNEGAALAAFSDFRPNLGSIVLGWPRMVMEDLRALSRSGEVNQWPRVAAFRLAQLLGNYRGARRPS